MHHQLTLSLRLGLVRNRRISDLFVITTSINTTEVIETMLENITYIALVLYTALMLIATNKQNVLVAIYRNHTKYDDLSDTKLLDIVGATSHRIGHSACMLGLIFVVAILPMTYFGGYNVISLLVLVYVTIKNSYTIMKIKDMPPSELMRQRELENTLVHKLGKYTRIALYYIGIALAYSNVNILGHQF